MKARLIAGAAGLAVAAVALTGCSADGAGTASTSPSATATAAASRIDPFAGMPKVASFELTSTDIATGKQMPTPQRSGLFGIPDGKDRSPELSWSGAPDDTKSFVVTMFDGDAATGSGFWHWAVKDIPATTTSLPTGAGVPNSSTLPAGAVQLPGDAGSARYIGGAPPAGDIAHHYYVTVWALDTDKVDVPDTTSVALLSNTMSSHVLGRATLVPVATTKS